MEYKQSVLSEWGSEKQEPGVETLAIRKVPLPASRSDCLEEVCMLLDMRRDLSFWLELPTVFIGFSTELEIRDCARRRQKRRGRLTGFDAWQYLNVRPWRLMVG